MTGFTEEQIAELTAALKRGHIKLIEKAGRKVSYLEGWHVIAEANRIFGFDAWDRQTADLRCVVEKETKIGREHPQRDGWRVGYICKVCVIVRNDVSTTVREGTGYGSGIDIDLGAAHESAAKEAETDATKRALMTFGNPFGLALYDKGQANVEALAPLPAGEVTSVRPAAKLPPAVPRTPADQAPTVPRRDHPKRAQALEAWKRINGALIATDDPKLIGEIMAVNKLDMYVIREVNPPTFNDLIELARAKGWTAEAQGLWQGVAA